MVNSNELSDAPWLNARLPQPAVSVQTSRAQEMPACGMERTHALFRTGCSACRGGMSICFVVQVGSALAVDLTAAEEECRDAAVQVAVTSRGQICGITQRGAQGVSPDYLQASAVSS